MYVLQQWCNVQYAPTACSLAWAAVPALFMQYSIDGTDCAPSRHCLAWSGSAVTSPPHAEASALECYITHESLPHLQWMAWHCCTRARWHVSAGVGRTVWPKSFLCYNPQQQQLTIPPLLLLLLLKATAFPRMSRQCPVKQCLPVGRPRTSACRRLGRR